jgi:sugar phosphate isomerase/epimerase
MNPALDIRIGTLVSGGNNPVEYIRQILPHGFESFQLTWWQTLGNTQLTELSKALNDLLSESGAIISSIGMYGNPLGDDPEDPETIRGWEQLIDNAHLFGTNVVCGFAGRVVNQPIPDSMPRFKQVFGDLVKRAEDKGVKIAFENCDMGGDWWRGDWNIAQNPKAWEIMFNEVASDHIGLEWEPCHQMVSLIDPMPQLREWITKIFHVHGKCATIKHDLLAKYGIHGPEQVVFHRTPGFGDCNWTDIISELRWGGFKGSIDIEGWHDPIYKDALEMTGQVRSLNYLKACRGGDFVPNPTV